MKKFYLDRWDTVLSRMQASVSHNWTRWCSTKILLYLTGSGSCETCFHPRLCAGVWETLYPEYAVVVSDDSNARPQNTRKILHKDFLLVVKSMTWHLFDVNQKKGFQTDHEDLVFFYPRRSRLQIIAIGWSFNTSREVMRCRFQRLVLTAWEAGLGRLTKFHSHKMRIPNDQPGK